MLKESDMKNTIRNIGLLALLVLAYGTAVYAGTQKKQTDVVWRLAREANGNDSTNAFTIVVDSNQLLLIKSMLSDSVFLFKADGLLKSDIDNLQCNFAEFQKKVEQGDYGYTQLWTRVMLFVIIGIMLMLLIYIILLQRELSGDSKRIDKRKEEIDILKREIGGLNNNSSDRAMGSLKREMQEMKEEMKNNNRVFGKQLLELEEKMKIKDSSFREESHVLSNQQKVSKPVESQKLLYADSIIDGVFSHVWERENDDTVFVLKQKNETRASITISDRAYKKVLANPSYLDGCDKQVVYCNSVVILNEGEAEKGGNGKWKVVSPLKVELR